MAGVLPGCGRKVATGRSRVILLALDGLDPRILQPLMQQGRVPNFAQLAKVGSFRKMMTSTPAQTPVAFSNVISGADPGTHNIYDFIHRDPSPRSESMYVRPYFSTSDTPDTGDVTALPLGRWQLPLSGGGPELKRQGGEFWNKLAGHRRRTSVFYMPATYPPPGQDQLQLISGMGTPDLLGGYGDFTFFSPDAPLRPKDVAGGRMVNLRLWGHRGSAELIGPPDPAARTDADDETPSLRIGFDVVRDPEHAVAKIHIGKQTLIMQPREWSAWVPIEFVSAIPGAEALSAVAAPTVLPGMVRFFLKSVHPKLELYVSPINIDPTQPVTTVSSPSRFSRTLGHERGRFYTTGIPEDTKALSAGALDEYAFLAQVELVHEERARQYHDALKDPDRGLLAFYFGSSDLISHMFWRDRDPQHPGRRPDEGYRYANVIDDHYVRLDALVGDALAHIDGDDTLVVMSDHGFTSFRREVNLNTWLLERDYIALKPGANPAAEPGFISVDWERSRAYALGINGLYLNVRGRERAGTVNDGHERKQLAQRLRSELMALRDDNGPPVIDDVAIVAEKYPNADPRVAPDLIVGYADGYRVSWSSPLGGFARPLITDNLDRWSGDHCVNPALVPGIVLSNRDMQVDQPELSDIAPTVLGGLGVQPPPHMVGRDLLHS